MITIQPGYRAYNGHVFTASETNRYNRITADIQNATYPATIATLGNLRHAEFCRIIGVTWCEA